MTSRPFKPRVRAVQHGEAELRVGAAGAGHGRGWAVEEMPVGGYGADWTPTHGREERWRLSAFALRNRSAPKQAAAARAPMTTKTAKPPGYVSPGKGCVLSAVGDAARGGGAGGAAEDGPRRTAGTSDGRAAALPGWGESGPAPRATDGATRETTSGAELSGDVADVPDDPTKVTSEVTSGEPAPTFVARNFVTGDVVAGGVVTGEVTGTVVIGRVTGSVVTGNVTGSVVTGKVTGSVVTGKVTGTVVTGRVTGSVVTGNVSGSVVTGKVTGTVVTGKVTGGRVTGAALWV